MATQVTNYQCPSCTGPLQFSPETGKLECAYCGSSFAVAEVETFYAEKNQKAELNARTEKCAVGEGWGADAAHMRSYLCPSCGAELICDDTTAATACPYCGNPSVVPGQFGDTRRPDYVIPFKVDKEAAIAGLKNHYKRKPLLPRAFALENHLQEIKGVYVPFWLFDAEARADVTFSATRSHVHTTRDERIITTEHYRVGRSGTVSFGRVPVDGSSKMPDAHMDAIEPFNYEELKPFSLGYLPGFLADKYDVGAEDCAKRADERCRNSAIEAMADTVTGYETRTVQQANVQLRRENAKYALMPVWLLNTKWQDRNYLFAMNGQTGKLIGDLPVSKGKLAAWFIGLFTVLALAGCLMFPPEGAILGGGAIAAVICMIMANMMKTARTQNDAHAYIRVSGVHLTGRYDQFLRRSVSRQRIRHDSPSSGGMRHAGPAGGRPGGMRPPKPMGRRPGGGPPRRGGR